MSEIDKKIQNTNVIDNKVDPNESPFKPLTDHQDKYLWLLCAVPILGSLFLNMVDVNEGVALLVYVIPNIAFALLDERSLKKQGRVCPAHWTVLVVPVYIWQRLKLNQQKKTLFYIWIAAFLVSLIIDSVTIDEAIEVQSCELVTQIIHEQYYISSVDCIAVNLGDSVTDDFYKGVATLSNGHEVDITVDLRKEGEIYVQVIE